MIEEERLIRALESVRRDKHKPWRYIIFTFVNGLAYGLGIGIGMTLMLGMTIFVLTRIVANMVNIPIIGEHFHQLGIIIDAYSKQAVRVR